MINLTVEEGFNNYSMNGAKMAVDEVNSLGTNHDVVSNEDIQWNEIENS